MRKRKLYQLDSKLPTIDPEGSVVETRTGNWRKFRSVAPPSPGGQLLRNKRNASERTRFFISRMDELVSRSSCRSDSVALWRFFAAGMCWASSFQVDSTRGGVGGCGVVVVDLTGVTDLSVVADLSVVVVVVVASGVVVVVVVFASTAGVVVFGWVTEEVVPPFSNSMRR